MIRRGRSRSIGVPRKLVDDPTLSFRAVGVAVFILGKPDDWRVDGRALARTHAEGRDAVFAALKELETVGYLVRRRYQDPASGKWWSESVLYETLDDAAAEDVEQRPEPNPENQDPGNQDPENRDPVDQDPSLSPKRDIRDSDRGTGHSGGRHRPAPAGQQAATATIPRNLFHPDDTERPPPDQAAADIGAAREALRRAAHPDPRHQEAAS